MTDPNEPQPQPVELTYRLTTDSMGFQHIEPVTTDGRDIENVTCVSVKSSEGCFSEMTITVRVPGKEERRCHKGDV